MQSPGTGVVPVDGLHALARRTRSGGWIRLVQVVRSLVGRRGWRDGDLGRRRVELLTIMCVSAMLSGFGMGASYLLLDVRLWPLSLFTLSNSVGCLLPLALLRGGRSQAAAHVFLGLTSVSVVVVAGMLVGRDGGQHWFLWMVAVASVAIWPQRRALVAGYFVANLTMFLVIEFFSGEPVFQLRVVSLSILRACSLAGAAATVSMVAAVQAWFTERDRKLLWVSKRSLLASNRRLRESQQRIEVLEGIIPICAWCKNVRTDEGYWQRVETFVQSRTRAAFSHSICPECMQIHFPADPSSHG